MKCELKYVIHENTKSLVSTTLPEWLIIVTLAILIGIFSSLCGVSYIILTILAVFGFGCYCLLLKDAVEYCKNRKE